jgi:hypothetical protein
MVILHFLLTVVNLVNVVVLCSGTVTVRGLDVKRGQNHKLP